MASVTKSNDENASRADAAADDRDATQAAGRIGGKGNKGGGEGGGGDGASRGPSPAGPRRSYFTVYKRGQGYWTRMGTLIGTSILGIMLAYTLYDRIPTFFGPAETKQLDVRINALTAELMAHQSNSNPAQPNFDPSKRLAPAVADQKQAELTQLQSQKTAANQAKQSRAKRIGLIVAASFLALYAATALYLMNKPANVDFLIATDGEMKKVNWTSRKELIGSTKVVVVFMFLIAFILFLIDQIFHLLFWAGGKGVLEAKPFWWPW